MPGRTILVIDYDPQSVESTRKSLVEAGYRVEVATDGVEGLKAFERTRPDLVLIEPMVPKKHGFQVCREIKGSARGQLIPVLITTAFYKGRKHKASAREQYGCDDYLEKPIAQDDLLAACRRWVEDRSEAPAAAAPRARPAPHSAALDDLSDEEIVERLDSMIDAVTGPAEPEPPQVASAPLPVAVAAAPVERPPPRASPAPSLAPTAAPVRSEPHVRAATSSTPAGTARPPSKAPLPARAEPRTRSAEAAALASGTTRAVVAATATGPATTVVGAARSRRVTYAVLPVVLAGVAVLAWMLGRPAVQGSTDLARRPKRANPSATSRAAPLVPLAEPSPPEHAPSGPTLTPRAADSPAVVEREAVAKNVDPAATGEARRQVASGEPRQPPVAPAAPAERADATTDAKPLAEPTVAPSPEESGGLSEPTETSQAAPPVEEIVPLPSPSVAPGMLVMLSEVDVAPVPIRKDAPLYPPMARNLRQQGTVILRVLVDETGGVERAEVLRGIDGRLLDSAALRVVKGWRYRPATESGVAVKVWITEQVVFRL